MTEAGKAVEIATGVWKTIKRKGSGNLTPLEGDLVTVAYKCFTPEKQLIASSCGKPCALTLGQGKVPLAWEQAIATMKKGEVAIIVNQETTAKSTQCNTGSHSPSTLPFFVLELIDWTSKCQTICSGVSKTVVKSGTGEQRPGPQDICQVKYTVKKSSNGEVVASSGGAIIEMSPAGKLPLKAFKTALLSMQRGEVARFTLQPASHGSDTGLTMTGEALRDDTEPNAADSLELELELELKAWSRVQRLRPDGSVTKRILRLGLRESPPPQLGAKARLSITGSAEDGSMVFSHSCEEPLEVEIGIGQMGDELDDVLLSMHCDESAEVVLQPQCGLRASNFGSSPNPAATPPVVLVTVELLSFEQVKETSGATPEEQISAASSLKARGNELYEGSKYSASLRWYRAALQAAKEAGLTKGVAGEEGTDEKSREAAKALCTACQLNISAALLQLQDWNQAVEVCSQVLAKQPNAKAFFRRGEALFQKGSFLEAANDVKRAISMQPGNKSLRKLLMRIRSAQAEDQKAADFKFAKVSKVPTSKDATQVEAPPAVKKLGGYTREHTAMTNHIDSTDEELQAAHEQLLNDAYAKVADEVSSKATREATVSQSHIERFKSLAKTQRFTYGLYEVREMKAALGFDVQVPEPDAKVGWVNRGYRRPKTDGLLLARGVEGTALTQPFGFFKKHRGRIPQGMRHDSSYLLSPSYSQLQASLENLEGVMEPDPYATPIVITESAFAGIENSCDFTSAEGQTGLEAAGTASSDRETDDEAASLSQQQTERDMQASTEEAALKLDPPAHHPHQVTHTPPKIVSASPASTPLSSLEASGSNGSKCDESSACHSDPTDSEPAQSTWNSPQKDRDALKSWSSPNSDGEKAIGDGGIGGLLGVLEAMAGQNCAQEGVFEAKAEPLEDTKGVRGDDDKAGKAQDVPAVTAACVKNESPADDTETGSESQAEGHQAFMAFLMT